MRPPPTPHSEVPAAPAWGARRDGSPDSPRGGRGPGGGGRRRGGRAGPGGAVLGGALRAGEKTRSNLRRL